MNAISKKYHWLFHAEGKGPGNFVWSDGKAQSWSILVGPGRVPVVSGTGWMRPFGRKLLAEFRAANAGVRPKPRKVNRNQVVKP